MFGTEELMNEVVKVEIPVEPETARALGDSRRIQAIGRLVDRMVRPVRGDDPLVTVLEATRRAAREAGLTDKDIDDELEAYRAERQR
jgi:pantoate kinase